MFFINLSYENTCLVWVNLFKKRTGNDEWKWNYYYLLYYLEESKTKNNKIIYLNNRLSQIVRKHYIKPLATIATYKLLIYR